MAPTGLACICVCMCVLHVRPLTLYWSDWPRLEAPVTSPDLSKARIPPPIFIITISNFNFQFLPPSFSQFATKLHPWERRWGDCRTRACKHIYNAAGERAHTSPLITVMLNVNVSLCTVCECVCASERSVLLVQTCLWPSGFINMNKTEMQKKWRMLRSSALSSLDLNGMS